MRSAKSMLQLFPLHRIHVGGRPANHRPNPVVYAVVAGSQEIKVRHDRGVHQKDPPILPIRKFSTAKTLKIPFCFSFWMREFWGHFNGLFFPFHSSPPPFSFSSDLSPNIPFFVLRPPSIYPHTSSRHSKKGWKLSSKAMRNEKWVHGQKTE